MGPSGKPLVSESGYNLSELALMLDFNGFKDHFERGGSLPESTVRMTQMPPPEMTKPTTKIESAFPL